MVRRICRDEIRSESTQRTGSHNAPHRWRLVQARKNHTYNTVTNGDLADDNPLGDVGLTLTLSGGVDAELLRYIITVDETVNDEDPRKFPDAPNEPPCGERVTIATQPLETSIIPIQGKQYTLETLGFTDCDAPGTHTNIFHTHQMAADQACLYARFVETTR